MLAVTREASETTGRSISDRLLLPAMAFTALAKLYLVFTQNINWDEFYYLSQVHAASQGNLGLAVQTIHVHPFAWLKAIPGNEISQIIAARLAYFGLHLGATLLLFLIARRLIGGERALLCTLFYFCFSFVVENATSFRTDGLAIFLILSGIYALVLSRRSWLHLVVAGVATALAGLVTIKTTIYLPTLLLLLVATRSADRLTHQFAAAIVFLTTAISAFIALHHMHHAALEIQDGSQALNYANNAAAKVIRLDQLFPRFGWLLVSVRENLFIWLLLLPGVVIAVAGIVKPESRARQLTLLACLLPLLSFAVYRNAFPYYYVFVFPLPLLLCAVGIEAIAHHRAKRGGTARPYKLAAIVGTVAMTALSVSERATTDIENQDRIVSGVHQIFPEPVPYIDRNSMISSFPKVGFFMSGWGMQKYQRRGTPLFRDLLSRREPVFLLVNSPALKLDGDDELNPNYAGISLFEKDQRILRDNYIPHWGPVLVAGKALDQLSDTPQRFEILIGGIYTLESESAVIIDDRNYRPGDFVRLEPGHHAIVGQGSAPADVRLRWGRNLPRPSTPLPDGPIYAGF